MAERRRIIEGTWTCGECGTEDIPGRDKRCPSCGAAREQSETDFAFGATAASGKVEAATVEDAEALELAEAGADWHCAYCGAGNRGDGDRCAACGAFRSELPPTDDDDATPPPPPEKKGMGTLKKLGIGLAVLVVLGLVFAFWATRTTDMQGEVTALAWTHQLHHERFTKVDAEGWRTELREVRPKMPVDGAGEVAGLFDIRLCTRREKEPERCETKTVSEECGTEEKCEVKDLGNGFAEEVCRDVPKMCEREVEECTEAVFDDWCTYSTHTWETLETRTTEGTTDAPTWPAEPSLGERDRARREADYAVTVAYDGGETHTLHPTDVEAFERWEVGARASLAVNNLGQVRDVQRIQD